MSNAMTSSQPELWQQEATRLGGERLVQIITEIRNGQKEIIDQLDEMNTRHTKAEEALAQLNKAFPAGDIEGHKRYHETMIIMLEERRRLRQAVQEKTISGLVWAGIVGVGMLVWHELQNIVNAVQSVKR